MGIVRNVEICAKQELELPQMVANNQDAKRTAFTITVDAKVGTTTGISAGDRALTLRALSDSKVLCSTFFVKLDNRNSV